MKIAIIGGGNLGTAIAQGLLKSDFCTPSEIIITKRNISALKGELPKAVKVTNDNLKATQDSEVIILAVKPFQVESVMELIAPALTKKTYAHFGYHRRYRFGLKGDGQSAFAGISSHAQYGSSDTAKHDLYQLRKCHRQAGAIRNKDVLHRGESDGDR